MKEITLTIRKHTLRQYKRNFTKLQWKRQKLYFDRNTKYVYTCEDEFGDVSCLVGVETKHGNYEVIGCGKIFYNMTKTEMLLELVQSF